MRRRRLSTGSIALLLIILLMAAGALTLTVSVMVLPPAGPSTVPSPAPATIGQPSATATGTPPGTATFTCTPTSTPMPTCTPTPTANATATVAFRQTQEAQQTQVAARATATATYLASVGGQIAFASNGGIEIMNGDGSHVWVVASCNTCFLGGWSPDMKYLLYAAGDENGWWDVFVADLVDLSKRNLTKTGSAGDWPGAFSPDGKQIVFSSNRAYSPEDAKNEMELYVMNADGSNVRKLVSHSDIDPKGVIFQRAGDNPRLLVDPQAWSPDGSKIAFCANWSGGGDIYVVGVDGAGLRNLTNKPEASSCHAAWSPDGRHIAFSARTERLRADIFVMRSDGSGSMQLTSLPGNQTGPTWSFDNRLIAFVSDSADALCYDGIPVSDVYIMNADGSNQRKLTNSPRPSFGCIYHAAFSPRPSP